MFVPPTAVSPALPRIVPRRAKLGKPHLAQARTSSLRLYLSSSPPFAALMQINERAGRFGLSC